MAQNRRVCMCGYRLHLAVEECRQEYPTGDVSGNGIGEQDSRAIMTGAAGLEGSAPCFPRGETGVVDSGRGQASAGDADDVCPHGRPPCDDHGMTATLYIIRPCYCA